MQFLFCTFTTPWQSYYMTFNMKATHMQFILFTITTPLQFTTNLLKAIVST